MTDAEALIIIGIHEKYDDDVFRLFQEQKRISNYQLIDAIKKLNKDGVLSFKNEIDNYSIDNLQIMSGSKKIFNEYYNDAIEHLLK